MKSFRTKINSKKVYQKNHTRKFRIGLLAALMLCVFGAKAQTDYSGIYYIASYGYPDDLCYDPTNIGSNFYLRPAANPVRPNNIDAYWFPINHPEQNDPEKPFLTTNHTGHDMSIAAWAIQKTGDYYYFIHVGTGKYVRYQPCYSGDPSGDARRKAMHLEAFDAAPDNDSCKFVIEVVDDDNAVYAIRPKTLTDGNRYWNVSSGNTTSNNGQGGSLYFNGLIGIYSAKGYSVSGKFSNWKFEPQIPVLSSDETNQQVIVSGLWPNADIRYTLDGSDPTNASAQCTDGIISIGDARKTVKVRAYYNGLSTEVSTINVDFRVWNEITDLSQITNMDKRYILIDDIDDASCHVTIDGFTGGFDGNFKTITGLTQPLFSTLDGGYTSGEEITVCNVILKDVDIVGHEGNTGAIACTAKGNVCIYNCGIIGDSKVGGTGDTGGLVGLLLHYSYSPSEPKYSFARVVNCYSFANIVAAGTYAAGIVGNNNCGSNAQNYGALNFNLRTAVVNCVFYGDITGGTNRYPVYGNKELHNNTNGINNYNYYREKAKFDDGDSYDKHNISWPVKEEFLTRFEYYRNILNCNRNLCAFYVSGAPYSDPTNEDAHGKIAKWVLDPEIAPYPILKRWDKYPSIINPDPDRVWDTLTKQWKNRETEALPYQGRKMGTLSVTVKAGKHPRLDTYGLNADQYGDKSLTLNILDMDTLNHDYGYYKVQLPYFNEEFGNPNGSNHYEKYCANYTDSIVTGWKITLVNGSDGGGYTFNDDWEAGCNFADRTDQFKDLYAKSGRVFAQGGYYYVPDDVTSITIEAYWGRAVYVHNAYHSVDRVDLGGSPFDPAGTYSNKFNGQDVYTSIKSAIAQLSVEGSGTTALTVYDQAVVLVGNVQHKNGADQRTLGWGGDSATSGSEAFATNNKPYTITSIDLDFDNEPDYCLQLQWGRGTTRVNIHPVRFDFLPVPSLGMAIRKKNDFLYAIGLFSPRGHFEVTETAFMHTGQFEYETRTNLRKEEAPLILNGGEYEQFVSSRTWNMENGYLDRTKYIILGGHVWMKEFTPGKHTDCDAATRHCAVSVMGGEYANRFCLSGVFVKNTHVLNGADNPHCYTNGGKFGTMSGAGLENIAGDVTFEIDHSLIKEFYGGGLNAARPISGSINVTIKNSIVGKYCGGPFTGDMAVNTKVTTNASNTIFGYFYGGGNGGTNFNRNNLCDWTVPADAITEENWRSTDPITPSSSRKKGSFNGFAPLAYVNDNVGYQAQFEFELIDMSSGYPPDTPPEETENCAVMRTYRHEAQFTATQVEEVESTLTNCTVLHDFYGGGNLGKVSHNVTSTLINTEVWGSAYGGGNDSDAPSFSVHNPPTVTTDLVFPYRDKASVNHPGNVGFKKDGNVIRKYKWINPLAELEKREKAAK